jgi:hypothetical protein
VRADIATLKHLSQGIEEWVEKYGPLPDHILQHHYIRAVDLRTPSGRSPYPISILIGGEWLNPDGSIEPDRRISLDPGTVETADSANQTDGSDAGGVVIPENGPDPAKRA